MGLRKGIGTVVGLVVAVIGIVALSRLLDAITGLDHHSERASIAGLPVVILVIGPMLPLVEYFQAPSPETLAKLREAAVRSVVVAIVLAPFTALCVVGFGRDLETSDLAFWASAIIQFAVILIAVAVLKRSPLGRPPTAAESS